MTWLRADIIMRLTHDEFRDLAWKCGFAATHQRQVVYEAVVASHGHHSPEKIYAAVRRRIPSISLATVYNNLRLFVERGLLREVTPHAPTLRPGPAEVLAFVFQRSFFKKARHDGESALGR